MDILPPHVPLFSLVLEITVVVICCFHSSCCFIRVINFLRLGRQAVFFFFGHAILLSITIDVVLPLVVCLWRARHVEVLHICSHMFPERMDGGRNWSHIRRGREGERGRESLLHSLVFCG